jgi:hypothetical protein
MRWWIYWIIAFLAMCFVLGTLLSCVPLQITKIKVVEIIPSCGDCDQLVWETNQDAQCKVTYCENGMCYTSPLEQEYSTFHSEGVCRSAQDITITAIGKDGQTCSLTIE